MTRGMKGCYVYCTDEEMQNYFQIETSYGRAGQAHPRRCFVWLMRRRICDVIESRSSRQWRLASMVADSSWGSPLLQALWSDQLRGCFRSALLQLALSQRTVGLDLHESREHSHEAGRSLEGAATGRQTRFVPREPDGTVGPSSGRPGTGCALTNSESDADLPTRNLNGIGILDPAPKFQAGRRIATQFGAGRLSAALKVDNARKPLDLEYPASSARRF